MTTEIQQATRQADIFLVEDNPDDRVLTLRVLRRHWPHKRVDVAEDGEEALEYLFCRGRHAARMAWDTPRLILLDLKLPKVSGLEVLQAIKGDARTQAIPIIALTSSKEEQDIVASYQLGVNSYIVKPVEHRKFEAAVQQVGAYWITINEPPTL